MPRHGALFKYIQEKLRPDVYDADDYFAWEGSYALGGYGRERAARNLINWVRVHDLEGIDVVTHSHGGNVLLQATAMACRFGEILLLSCPVRKEYRLDRRAVKRARSVRIKFDLVLLADRSRQIFPRRSGIEEVVLPIWFWPHGTTTEPKVWGQHGIRI